MKAKIVQLANAYAHKLKNQIALREVAMENDNKSHYLIYHVLGISDEEGHLIDLYQNKGRFLYQYAGAFLEEAVFLCFQEHYPQTQRAKVKNNLGVRPKNFEIDCLVDNDALEIKWRDATTDGDHITKEHTRLQVIKNHGYKPIRIMFFEPNRDQARKIQATLKTVYQGIGGEYYSGNEAWDYLFRRTQIDLRTLLADIAYPGRRPT